MKTGLKLPLSPHLLWEYDQAAFDFDRSKKIVIERVIERGNLQDWRIMVHYYGKGEVLRISRKSRTLSERDRRFTELFLPSKLLDEVAH